MPKHTFKQFENKWMGLSRPVFVGETPSANEHSPSGHKEKEKEEIRGYQVSEIKRDFDAQKAIKEKSNTDLLAAFRGETMDKNDLPSDVFRAEDLEMMEKEVLEKGSVSTATQEKIDNKLARIGDWLDSPIKKGPFFSDTTNGTDKDPELQKEADFKRTIRDLLESQKYEKQLQAYRAAREKNEEAEKNTVVTIVTRAETVINTGKGLETFGKNGNFKAFENGYERAVNSLTKSPEFAIFRETQENVESAKVAQEYRQLFLALMESETEKFKTDLAFGTGFGPNATENKRKFPDIYELWLGKDGTALYSNQEGVANKVEDLRKQIDNNGISPGLQRVVEITLPDILKNAPKTQAEAEANIGAFSNFIRNQNDKKGSLGNYEKSYREDRKLAEKYLALAKEQKSLLTAEESIKLLDAKFVASEMTNKQEVTEICLRKFKKAHDIVDGLLEGAGLSRGLNTEVKRLLITEVYKNGVSTLKIKPNGTPVFEDNTMAYSAVLKDILNSEYFKKNYEKPLTNDQRDLLAIAIKRGLEMGKLEQEIKIQKEYKVPTAESDAYVTKELAFRAFPKDVRDFLNAKNAQTYNGLTPEYKKIFEPNGQLKVDVDKLASAMIENNAADIQTYQYAINEFIADKSETERTQIQKVIVSAKKAITAHGEKEVARTAYERATTGNQEEKNIRGYVGNRLKLGEMEEEEKLMQASLKDPTTKESQAWIASAKGRLEQEDKANNRFEKDNGRFKSVDNISITYGLLDRNTRGLEGMMAEVMDIEFRGLYPSYIMEVQANPRLEVGNWEMLFNSHEKKDRQMLIDLLRKIIPEGKRGGKQDLIFMLENMDNDSIMGVLSKGEGPQMAPKDRAKAAALSMVGIIRAQIMREKSLDMRTMAQQQEFENRLEGKTISEYMTNILGTFWKMGVGGSWTEKGVAAFVGYMLFKAGSKAFGEKPGIGGNLFKLGLGFMAFDIGLKKVTGKGALEHVSVHNIRNAFEGTDEAALVKHGREIADSALETGISINEEQQFEATQQMRNVPFNKLVEWYKTVKANPKNMKPAAGKPDLFAKFGIVTDAIYEHSRNPNLDPDLVGRVAVYKMIKSLFDYAGNQDGNSRTATEDGQRSIEARWINPLLPKGSTEVAGTRYTGWMPPEKILKKHKGNPNGLTWKEVMEIEIRQSDRLATIDDNISSQGYNWASNVIQAGVDSFRVSIQAPTRAKTDEYLNKTRYEWTPKAKELVGDMADKVSSQAQFAENRVVLWYGANKDLAIELAGKNVGVVAKAAMLPLKFMLAVDKNVIEIADTGLNRLNGSIEAKYGFDIPMLVIDKEPEDNLFTDSKTRPFFGEQYADHFQKAWLNTGDPETSRLSIDETGVSPVRIAEITKMVTEAVNPKDAPPLPNSAAIIANKLAFEIEKEKLGPIAYYVAEMDINEVPEQYRGNPMNVMLYMKGNARKKAAKELKVKLKASNKNVDKYNEKFFDDYLRSITDVPVIKTVSGGKPEKMYFFFRMPLAESVEVYRKKTDTWHDSTDPRELKDDPPFVAESGADVLDNMTKAYSKDKNLDLVIKVLKGAVGIIPQQLAKIATGLASLAKESLPENWTTMRNFFEKLELSEDTKRKLDDFAGAYVSEYLAMSAFYRGGTIVVPGDLNDVITPEQAKINREKKMKEVEDARVATPPPGTTPPSAPTP